MTSVPHPSAGEAPKAFVGLDPLSTSSLGSTPEEIQEAAKKALLEWTRLRMARYKQPDGGIVFVAEVPKSASGKVLRRLLH